MANPSTAHLNQVETGDVRLPPEIHELVLDYFLDFDGIDCLRYVRPDEDDPDQNRRL